MSASPTELQKAPPATIAQARITTPNELLAVAVQQGNTAMIETLARLQMQVREKDEEAAFNRSMHTAQSEMRRIGADATNPQTRSKYLTFSKLDGALRPIYTQHGFSVSFNSEPGPSPDVLRMIAYVSHQDGHTRKYQIDMPADGKGAKGNDVMTRTHATGAAASYGSRYLLKMIFNVAVGESDDDGNSASAQRKRFSESALADTLNEMRACTNIDDLRHVYDPAYRHAQQIGDQDAMRELLTAKDKAKERL